VRTSREPLSVSLVFQRKTKVRGNLLQAPGPTRSILGDGMLGEKIKWAFGPGESQDTVFRIQKEAFAGINSQPLAHIFRNGQSTLRVNPDG
jgi:hypothetical protein